MAKKTKQTKADPGLPSMLVFTPSVLIVASNIRESKTNPRKHWDEKSLKDLAESINQHGILQPLIVRDAGKHYELVSGARRLRAAKIAGLKLVPCIVRELTDDQAAEIQVIENLHREDIHPMEEAVGYQQLLNSGKYTVEALSEKLGKSTTYIYSRLRLNHLIPDFKELFEKELLSYAVVRVICRHTEDFQVQLYKEFNNEEIYDGFEDEPEENIKKVLPSEIEEFAKNNLYKNLKYAPFDLSDKVLMKDKPCDTCKSNTACAGQLFPEYSKDAFCTDPGCYNEKIQAHIAVAEDKIKKDDYVKVSTCNQYGLNENLKKEGVLPENQYVICKKTDKGAKKALVVDVNPYNDASQKEVGKVIYITTENLSSSGSESRSGSGKSLGEKINEARGKNNNIVRVKALNAISAKMLYVVRDLIYSGKLVSEDIREMFLRIAFSRIDHDTLSKLKNLLHWDVTNYKNNGYIDYDKFLLDNYVNKVTDNESFLFFIFFALLAGKTISPDFYRNWEDNFRKESYSADDLNTDFIYELSKIIDFDYPGMLKELNDESIFKLKEKSKPVKKSKSAK